MSEQSSVFQSKENLPCRTCVDFKSWAKQQRQNYSHSPGSTKEDTQKTSNDEKNKQDIEAPRRPDCPLDKNELGQATWSLLHTMAAVYPEKPDAQQQTATKSFFNLLGRVYPCEYCAEDLRKELKTDPPKVSSQDELSQWLCRLHNKVNVKLGKPEFDCKLVNQRWRDGWLDGSCD